jgi:IS1 family transposase
VITFAERETRQTVGYRVSERKDAEPIQETADSAPKAAKYHSDGNGAYANVSYYGKYFSHTDKSETYTVEGVNSDLRRYIPGFARRSKCFYRKIETVRAVMAVFVRAFNKFSLKKYETRKLMTHKSSSSSRLHKYKDSPFALIDF